ncbi:MAG TPA: lamin tail domain-containing protein [Verrucomicrobiae bacterium]|nr:lamin tail domain-containing protein [Verrucomicrobiae bacterium]
MRALLTGILAAAAPCVSSAQSFTSEVEPAGPCSRKTPFAITEIMYRPMPDTNGNVLEFIEIYNSNPFFEDISGYRISGDIDYTFPPNTVLQGGEFRVIARNPAHVQNAYAISGVLGPYAKALPQSGTIRLRNKEGAVLLEIEYSNQPPWPAAADGAGHSLVLTRPSYGENRPQAWGISDRVGGSPGAYDAINVGRSPQSSIRINEFLANSEPPNVDFIELYNDSNLEVDLTGCSLSDDPHTNKFVLPNIRIMPRGFLTYYQNQLGFGLSSGGETIFLRNVDRTRVLDAVRFGPQAADLSSGRHPDGAEEIYPLAQRTPGAANSDILIHDIVINEIMYNPISTLSDDEYVELYNHGPHAVDLGGWKFIAGIEYEFPTNTALAAGGYLVIAKNVARLLTNYPNLNAANTRGNFQGKLRDKGDRVALARPDSSVTTNSLGQVRTNTVYVVIDEVAYGVGGNWGAWANGGGSSLELIDPRSNHRLAHNWADSDETAKAPWTLVEFNGLFDHGYETPYNLQVMLLGEGECLLDNVEIFAPGGANLCTNGTFETGLSTWTARGTHLRSTIEGNGFQSGHSLHVRASARGDTGLNRLRVPLAAVAPTNAPGTIRARVRWLCGWPEIILRTHGNWGECFGRMVLPGNLGTPGARNSRALSNAPPAVYEVHHEPVLPAGDQSVVVTCRVSDPDGIASLSLLYRIDPSPSQNTVPMRDDGTAGDAIAGDGIFSATIAGQPAGALAAFQIVAADTLGASRVFPLQDASYRQPFECLVRFGDPIPAGSFGTYRLWMTQGNLSDWQQRPSMSNERIFGTFVYGTFRAVYNMSVKWAGSPFHQFSVGPSPDTTEANYSIEMPLDDQVLGTENFNKLHAPGNGPFEDASCQREQICYWTARQLGLPWGYRRFVNVFFNGNRRGGTTALMEDAQSPGSDMVNQFFPDDTGGNLYKMQLWFETGDVSAGPIPFTPVAGCELNRYNTVSNGVTIPKIARLRNTFLTRSANGTANDYGPVLALIDAANTTPGPALTSRLSEVADVEEWFRIFAVEHASGNWDSFGAQSSQNMYGYMPQHGKYTLLIWDWNTVLGGNSGAWAPGQNLFLVNEDDTAIPAMFRHAPFRRMYLRALKEVCTGPWAGNPINDVLDAKFSALRANGIAVAEPGADGIKAYMAAARTSILQTVANEDAGAFKITVTNQITSSNNLVVITGEAPVEARTITINGREYPITWIDPKTFRIQFVAESASNSLVIQGQDFYGRPLAGFTTNLTVILTRTVPDPESVLVINEIMYHPSVPAASYVEIHNASDFSFNVSGWRVNGLDYTFPAGSIISNRQYLVLAADRPAFTAAYGGAPLFDLFDGVLDPDGETLSLERPMLAYATNSAVVTSNLVFRTVDKVRYAPGPPWPPLADGGGASLQLIDPTLDNSRPSAWTDHEEWRRVAFTGVISGGTTPGTNFVVSLSAPGEVFIDDLVLVTGTRAEVGPNLLANGDFESPLSGSWSAVGNHASSLLSTQFSHGGSASLRVIASGPGALTNSVVQSIPAFPSSTICTLSFWFRPNSNVANIVLRTTPGSSFSSSTSLRPIVFTPGAANAAAGLSVPYDLVWLNEIQPDNRTGIVDSRGEHDPWIELYNSGTNAVDLSGYFLADNYTNGPTGWQFPAGAALTAGGFAIVWLDGQPGQSTAAEWHANFRPNPQAGVVTLVRLIQNRPQITDYLAYSNGLPDLSYGAFPDGQPFTRQRFFQVTPSAPNNARDVTLFINEWMASNTSSQADPADGKFDDWFEIYNPDASPVDLGGYFLTDNLGSPRQFQVPANGQYIVPADGFLLVWADNETNQNTAAHQDLHAGFQLRAAGEAIALFAPDGRTAIDSVVFGPQTNGISQGRFADGAAAIYYMITPTPRGRNVIGLPPPHVSIARDGDGIAMTFQTLVGRFYRVDFKNSLAEEVWTPLASPVQANSDQLTVLDDLRAGPQRFYRIVQVQ